MLDYTQFGFAFDIFSALNSVFSVMIYVNDTYEDQASDQVRCGELRWLACSTAMPLTLYLQVFIDLVSFFFLFLCASPFPFFPPPQGWTHFAEISVAVFFLIEYILRLLAAEERLGYIFIIPALVDMVTTLPVLIPLVGGGGSDNGFTFFRVLRLLRVMRVLRIHKLVTISDSLVQRQLFNIAYTVFVLVFCAAGLFHNVEGGSEWEIGDEIRQLTFHDAVYMTIITVGIARILFFSFLFFFSTSLGHCFCMCV